MRFNNNHLQANQNCLLTNLQTHSCVLSNMLQIRFQKYFKSHLLFCFPHYICIIMSFCAVNRQISMDTCARSVCVSVCMCVFLCVCMFVYWGTNWTVEHRVERSTTAYWGYPWGVAVSQTGFITVAVRWSLHSILLSLFSDCLSSSPSSLPPSHPTPHCLHLLPRIMLPVDATGWVGWGVC